MDNTVENRFAIYRQDKAHYIHDDCHIYHYLALYVKVLPQISTRTKL